MSKITNDDLTRSGTGCYRFTHMALATVGINGFISPRPTKLEGGF